MIRLRALRDSCPEAEIHVATWFYIQGILNLLPDAGVTPMVIKDLRTEITYRISKSPSFDLAVNLNYDRLSLIETVATGAPLRVGPEQADGPDWWLTHRVPIDNNRHKLDEVLDMGEAAGIPRPEGPFGIDIPPESEWSRKLDEYTVRLKEKGLTVPGDISMVGVGGLSETTSTIQSYEGMGRAAAERLLEKIKNPDSKPERVVLSTPLVIRNSTKKLK